MNGSKVKTKPTPWVFFSLTFALTWAFWIPAGLNTVARLGPLPRFLHYAGGIMPTLVALYLLYRYDLPQVRREYWRRLVDFRRIGLAWYGVIFLAVPLLTLVGIVLGGGIELDAAANILNNPLSLLPFAFMIFLFGPLPEEMAWRGYALDGLQSRLNALSSSLILGLAWTLWHLPLFFIQGSYQQGLGIGTPQFWLYLLDKIPQSIWMTWIFNNNRRSTLSAVLFHFMVNFVGELFNLPFQGEVFYILSWWVGAVLIVLVWRPDKLVKRLGSRSGQ